MDKSKNSALNAKGIENARVPFDSSDRKIRRFSKGSQNKLTKKFAASQRDLKINKQRNPQILKINKQLLTLGEMLEHNSFRV